MSPYSKILTEDTLTTIFPVTSKMQSLEPGRSILIPCSNEGERDWVKGKIYNWIHIKGFPRGTFRLSSEGLLSLRIYRRGIGGKLVVKEEDQGKGIEWAMSHLLGIESEEDAIELLQKARSQGTLRAMEIIEALDEWRRVVKGEGG